MGFTRLSTGLSMVLFLGYLVPMLLPWTTSYLALIPAKTIPFVWNIITAGYVEQSIFGLIVSVSSLLLSGKLLEPIWGMREFLKFTVFVNTCTLAGVYVTAITSYYITRREAFLYMPLFGFHGVISSFLVGVKQIVPGQEIVSLGGFCLRAKWLPSLFVLMSIILSFFTSEAMPYLPFVLFGTYSGWLYARYLVRDPETNLLGSPGEEFAFSTFFPPFMRSTVDVLSSCCYTLLCQRRVPRKEEDNVLESTSSPFPDSAEVFRWRSLLNYLHFLLMQGVFIFSHFGNIICYLTIGILDNSRARPETLIRIPCLVVFHKYYLRDGLEDLFRFLV